MALKLKKGHDGTSVQCSHSWIRWVCVCVTMHVYGQVCILNVQNVRPIIHVQCLSLVLKGIAPQWFF